MTTQWPAESPPATRSWDKNWHLWGSRWTWKRFWGRADLDFSTDFTANHGYYWSSPGLSFLFCKMGIIFCFRGVGWFHEIMDVKGWFRAWSFSVLIWCGLLFLCKAGVLCDTRLSSGRSRVRNLALAILAMRSWCSASPAGGTWGPGLQLGFWWYLWELWPGTYIEAVPHFCSVAFGLSLDSAAEVHREGDDGGEDAAMCVCVCVRVCTHTPQEHSMETCLVNPLWEIYADYKVKRWGHSRFFFPGKEAKT